MRESWRNKKERMRAARMFLNEGEKENKRGGGGIEIGQRGGEKQGKKKKENEKEKCMDEMRERRNNIKNKKS